jgi:hypothetical protein
MDVNGTTDNAATSAQSTQGAAMSQAEIEKQLEEKFSTVLMMTMATDLVTDAIQDNEE